ncbi:MAG: DNA-binding beta-propeller fold protein YncE [Nitrospinales bacterium]|jgi:DNA-binding beta-propeller fold protein YncE
MTSFFPVTFDASFRTKEDEELSPPSGICFTHDGNILLADDFNHRIQIYDPQFNLIASFGEKGKEQGQLQYPKGIAVDKEGNIFVADSWNHRIQKFDSQGKPLLSFGSCGDGKGELNEPYDILIDSSGTLIVVERYNHRIQFFDGHGKSLGWIGQRGTVLEEELAENYETPFNLLAPPLFEFPTSIATDSRGNYFVTDSGNHRILKFDKKWQLVLTFGEQGDEPGQFQYPLCVSIAANDLLYIADLNNNRIQIFTSFGQYLNVIEHEETPLEAPCLTRIDSAGNLFVGSTFDTKILKYQIPTCTENTLAEKLATSEPLNPEHVYYYSLVQAKNKNDPKSLAALEQTLDLLSKNPAGKNSEAPLHLGRLAFEGKKITGSSIDLAIPLIENQLNESRKSMTTAFQFWQEAAKKLNEIQMQEQKLILSDPQGLREFNKDLYKYEQEDRENFRQTRNTFYFFRKSTQQFYSFIYYLIESEINETQMGNISSLLDRQWITSVDIINEYFDQKEKCEESMVQILGDAGSDQLPSFLIKNYYSGRILDLLLHLQFQMRTHFQVLKVLARQAIHNKEIRKLLSGLTSSSIFSEKATRIMIRFHEHWQTMDFLEPQFLETLDSVMPHWENKNSSTLETSIDDFEPVAFDSENLDIEQTARVLQSQSAEIKFENGILLWGPNKYNSASLANQKSELITQCLATLKAQSVFEEKFQEIFDQLDDMERQRIDLDAQQRQVGTEDKTTPIGINNNMAVFDFQLNLIRRMIRGLDINEDLNLHRLISGAAIAQVLNQPQDNAQLFDELAIYAKKLDSDSLKFSRERKSKFFEMAALRLQQKQFESAHDISDIDASIKVDENIIQLQANVNRLELKLKRSMRSKNMIDLILNFTEANTSAPETQLKQVFSISKVGPEIGLPLFPQGLTHNSKGDLLVADYENHRIHCYSSEGKHRFHFGNWGNTPGAFKYPNNLATDSHDNIYVIDEGNGEVKKFDAEGNFILQFEEGVLGHVFSLSIDSQDQIHIADLDNNRIAIFDSNGKETPFSTEQSENLNAPCGVFCLEDGGTIVGDRSEFLLKRFDAAGKLINQVPQEGLGFDEIYFLACDPKYGIFGSDFWNNQIIHLNNNLEVIDIYRKQGNRTGGLGKTAGLSIHNGRLFVSNFDGRKVQVFNLPS